MEGFHGSIGNGSGNYSKAPKIKVPPGMKMQQLMIRSGRHHGNPLSSTTFDSHPENLDLKEPLLRYMCSGSLVAGKLALAGDRGFVPRRTSSPLSAVENLIERSPPPPTVYGTPSKAVGGEETLVMDGVLVRGGKRLPSFSGSDLSSASGLSGKSLFRTENCRFSEDSGNCGYSSKCQFSIGKEDARPTHLSIKNEAEVCRSYNSTGLSTYIPNPRFPPQVIAPIFAAAVAPARMASPTTSRIPTKTAPTTSMTPIKTISSITLMAPIKTTSPTISRDTKNILSTAIAWKDWLPRDDGIEVALPCPSTGKHPSRESVNAYIDGVLSGLALRRLPAFSEICTE